MCLSWRNKKCAYGRERENHIKSIWTYRRENNSEATIVSCVYLRYFEIWQPNNKSSILSIHPSYVSVRLSVFFSSQILFHFLALGLLSWRIHTLTPNQTEPMIITGCCCCCCCCCAASIANASKASELSKEQAINSISSSSFGVALAKHWTLQVHTRSLSNTQRIDSDCSFARYRFSLSVDDVFFFLF